MWRYQKADYYTTLCNALGETEIEREEWQLIFISDLQPDKHGYCYGVRFRKIRTSVCFLETDRFASPS